MNNIKISTFNVNSVKARLPNLLVWLKQSNPDVVLLQELKCVENDFPFEAILDVGYNAVVLGQKTYNGVAILSKYKIEDVIKSLPNFRGYGEEQARYIEAVISLPSNSAMRVASIYVPNGGGEILPNQKLEETEKFRYKLDFFDALHAHFKRLLTYDEIAVFGGDYNVALDDIDAYDAKNLHNTVCFHELEKQKFRKILGLGLVDSYRSFYPQNQAFTWWDYRGNSWKFNKGLRIDYLLLSPQAADRATAALIEDNGVRDLEKASDHCPMSVRLGIGN